MKNKPTFTRSISEQIELIVDWVYHIVAIATIPACIYFFMIGESGWGFLLGLIAFGNIFFVILPRHLAST